MTDTVFATAGGWALASDGVQWILQRRYPVGWRAVSFVRSTKAVLARCMREKGVDVVDSEKLLAGLPDTFDEWKSTHNLVSPAAVDDGLELNKV